MRGPMRFVARKMTLKIERESSLSNVRVFYLPPICTSTIQPLDAGIIVALKFGYRRQQMERALDNIVTEARQLHKLKF